MNYTTNFYRYRGITEFPITVSFCTQASSGRERPLCRQRHLSDIFRLLIPKPNPIPNLNPNRNPITDPNPNPKIKKKDTGMKLNIELYLKVDFLGTGVGL